MQVTTIAHVWLVTLAVSGMACAIVATAIMLLYPPDMWRWELSLSISLTVVISMPVTYFMARKMQQIAELSAELQRLVERDRLTNVATRDLFFARMDAAPHASGVVLMVDIDHFKRVNDTLGHMTGDQVIRSVALLMQGAVDPNDLVCRFGGEEFLVFLSGASLGSGYAVAEQMRKDIAHFPVEGRHGAIQVTVSVGVAHKRPTDPISDAIHQADAALYQAKTGGRNRTVVFESGPRPTRMRTVN